MNQKKITQRGVVVEKKKVYLLNLSFEYYEFYTKTTHMRFIIKIKITKTKQ